MCPLLSNKALVSNALIKPDIALHNFFILFCFQNGDVSLDNVTHEDAVAALKATGERVLLVLVPGPRHGQPSPRTSRANTRELHHC